MSIDSINNSTTSGASGASGTGGKKNTDNSNLSMDDFFQLMVAQLKNQDMYNTTDNTQFIAQMAQFSMVQALSDLSELSMTSYGVSLIGKEATIAKVGDDGAVKSIKGIVDSVNFYNGSTQVVIDGKSYALSSVMSVKEPDIIIPNSDVTPKNANTDTTNTTNKTDTTNNTNKTDTTITTDSTDSPGSNPDGSSI